MCWPAPGAGGSGGFLSFDFLPALVKVVGGHEPSDSGTVGVEWVGQGSHFPTRKALVTVGNSAELSKAQDRPSHANWGN